MNDEGLKLLQVLHKQVTMRSSYLEYFNKVSKPSVGYLLLVTIIAQLRDNTPLINFFY